MKMKIEFGGKSMASLLGKRRFREDFEGEDVEESYINLMHEEPMDPRLNEEVVEVSENEMEKRLTLNLEGKNSKRLKKMR